MTKKEQKVVDEELRKYRILSALRWTEKVNPDVPIPQWSDPLTTGYLPIAAGYGARVEKACSSSIHHNTGSWDRTAIQGARRLYSTRLLALRALRHETEEVYAERLYDIDLMIEEEEKRVSDTPVPGVPDATSSD